MKIRIGVNNPFAIREGVYESDNLHYWLRSKLGLCQSEQDTKRVQSQIDWLKYLEQQTQYWNDKYTAELNQMIEDNRRSADNQKTGD